MVAEQLAVPFEALRIVAGDTDKVAKGVGTFASRSIVRAGAAAVEVCEVEVDPETGLVQIVAMSVVDDSGHAVNPMVVYGQMYGAVVHGIGQALLERTVGAPAAVIHAILDALRPLGVKHLDMPATPETVPRAIATAKATRG